MKVYGNYWGSVGKPTCDIWHMSMCSKLRKFKISCSGQQMVITHGWDNFRHQQKFRPPPPPPPPPPPKKKKKEKKKKNNIAYTSNDLMNNIINIFLVIGNRFVFTRDVMVEDVNLMSTIEYEAMRKTISACRVTEQSKEQKQRRERTNTMHMKIMKLGFVPCKFHDHIGKFLSRYNPTGSVVWALESSMHPTKLRAENIGSCSKMKVVSDEYNYLNNIVI